MNFYIKLKVSKIFSKSQWKIIQIKLYNYPFHYNSSNYSEMKKKKMIATNSV